MIKMKLSVIIPVYNVEKYLRRCLDSICAQDYMDMEVICVNDGSQDSSGDILEEYKNRDARIQVIRQMNKGVTAARKAGMKAASGEYITFIDSDDWIEKENFSYVMSILKESNADMICSAYWVEFDGKELYKNGFEEGLYSGKSWDEKRKDAILNLEEQRTGIYPPLVSKVIKKSIMDDAREIVPDTITMYEDKAYSTYLLLSAESVYISHRPFYHYMKNDNSAMNRVHDNFLVIINELYHFYQGLYVHPNCTEEIRKRLELGIIQVIIRGINKYMGFSIPRMMWIDPDWKRRIPQNSKIILYGAGMIGQIYYEHIISDSQYKLDVVKWVDKSFEKYDSLGMKIEHPETIINSNYDYVVVAIKNVDILKVVETYLKDDLRVPKEKIILFENREIFWKYAEAMGYLRD